MDCHEFNKLNSRNDDSVVDCHAKTLRIIRNDGISADCHDSANTDSRNDRIVVDSHDSATPSLTMTAEDTFAKSSKSQSDSHNCDSTEIPQNIKSHNSDFIALIPAYKPTHSLITLAQILLQRNFIVIIVNDGSPSAFDSVFTQLPPQAILLKNAINLGKGAALKHGINYAINHFPNAKCIITLDCDGQHSVDDVLNLRDKFIANKVDLAIGTRGFKANVPLRSKFGNNLTAFIFRMLFGKRLQDTQSGLRAFSVEFGKKLLPLSFNGYEFEMQMLILACNNETKILQVPIRTIYIDNNASSHFNPIFDSLSIYCVLFRHIGNSLLTALIDYVVFVFSFAMGFSLFACMISGRIVAGSFNFIVGKNFVFKSKGNVIFEIVSYVLLTLFLMLISMKSIAIISTHSGISEILVKPFCEAGIFAISFLVQRFIIFSSKAKILDENRGGGN